MDLNKHKIAQSFNKHAKGYDESAHLQYHVSEVLASYMYTAIVRNSLPLDSNFAMVDIGCGTGFCIQSIVHMLAIKGLLDEDAQPSVLGLDIASEMVAECVAKFDEFKPQWQFAVADFDHYQVDKSMQDTQDIVTSSFSAHWLQDIHGFFEKAYKLLKDGGLLVVALPVDGSLKEISEVNKTLPEGEQLPMLEFPRSDNVMKSVIECGFIPKLHTRQGFSPLFPSGLDALKSMKNVGSTPPSTPPSTQKTESLAEITYRKTFLQKYDEMFLGANNANVNGVPAVALSYNVLFIIAQK